MRPPHLAAFDSIASWPSFTAESPLGILISACLANEPCGVEGTSYGDHPLVLRLFALPNVRVVKYCPETVAFGVPRATPDIDAGDGFDVLDGKARVLSDKGDDWTDGLVRTGKAMAELGLQNHVRLAVMMDISGACGSNAIYQGQRHLKTYHKGPGVAAAAVMRAGIPVVSQRDERTLQAIFAKLGAACDDLLTDGKDFWERDWYQNYFKK
jgi:uncharacterized protein YbbK (DUF523 family)